MDYACFKNIEDNYNLFLDFALSLSDSIAFHIVHYDVLSPDSLKMCDEYYKAHPEQAEEEIPVDYDYYDRMKKIIQPIEGAIIRKENKFSYLGYGYGHLCETFFIDTRHPEVREFLASAGSIFSWRYPDFPEDLSFLRNGKNFIRNVAHENMLFFYDIKTSEIERLNKLGIELISH